MSTNEGSLWGGRFADGPAPAGVVVGKRGTARLTIEELTGALFGSYGAGHRDAILDAAGIGRMVAAWKAEGLSVGFTNGCFDILHAGHVSLLNAARGQCDRLVLGLNSDDSVRRLKGAGRPVNDQRDRASVLAALAAVDAVVVATAPAHVQRERVLARPGMTQDRFNALLARQMSDVEKRARAHYLVITDKGLDHAREQVKMILADVRAKRNA